MLLLLALCFGRVAAASQPAPVSVDREPGAETCPDTAGLAAQVQAIIGHVTREDATPYRITFTHNGPTFSAAIRLGAANADSTVVRSLDAHEPTCTALAHATAIALAVLFDSDLGAENASGSAAAPSASKPDAASPTPPATVPEAPAKPRAPDANTKANITNDTERAPPASNAQRVDPLFAVGGSALVGVLRPVSFGLVADLGLESRRLRASVGALWVPTETLTLAPGSARESLLSGTLRGCYAMLRAGTLRLDACTGLLLGVARAQAYGFTLDEPQQHELFLAFPAELAVSGRARFIGWELSASALFLSPPNEFRVQGLGVIYHPAPIAGMFALRMFIEPTR